MRVFLLMLIALTTLTPSISYPNDQRPAASSMRPFWTEQASFTFDSTLYAIGVATNAPSSEAGRQAAFTNGLNEIRNYAQVSNLNGLLIETQMTFEEPQGDGRVSVWRLLRVSMNDLRVLKGSPAPLVSPVATAHTVLVLPIVVIPASASEPPKVRMEAPPSHLPDRIKSLQRTGLPTIPLRYPQVITGWTRDSKGRLAVEWQDRQEWYVAPLKPSEWSYARSLLNPR